MNGGARIVIIKIYNPLRKWKRSLDRSKPEICTYSFILSQTCKTYSVGVCRNVSIILLAHLLFKKTDWWLTKKGWNTRQQMLFRLTWANIQNLLWSVLAILENICLFCAGTCIGRDYLNVKYVCTEKGNVIRKLST